MSGAITDTGQIVGNQAGRCLPPGDPKQENRMNVRTEGLSAVTEREEKELQGWAGN